MMRVHHSADRNRFALFVVLVALALTATGCGASRAFGRAENAARMGDWDAAVEFYRRAVQQEPERNDYKIALERAMINASHEHLNQAQLNEARNELEEALREYRRASDFDRPGRRRSSRSTRSCPRSGSTTRASATS
jgi:tetratricopeptide (TPR) repeat protein